MKTQGLARVLSMVILLISTSEVVHSITCPTVITDVAPCLSFLRSSSASKPPQPCCNGIKEIAGEAASQTDRTAICQCLKQGLATIGNYDPKRIPLIPKNCGLSITLPPVDKNTDCSKFTMMM